MAIKEYIKEVTWVCENKKCTEKIAENLTYCVEDCPHYGGHTWLIDSMDAEFEFILKCILCGLERRKNMKDQFLERAMTLVGKTWEEPK